MAAWSGLAPNLPTRARGEYARAREEIRDDESISSSDTDSGSEVIPSTEGESGKIITESSNGPPQQEKCGCRNNCASFFCGCRSGGQECNEACKCSSACQNPFNNLKEVFGEPDKILRANACFASHLVQEAKEAKERADISAIEAKARARDAKKSARNAQERKVARELARKAKEREAESKSELKFIDLENLQDRLLGCRDISNYPSHPAFNIDNVKYLPDWKRTFLRGYISPEEREGHFQALCRYGLSEDGDPLEDDDIDTDDDDDEESVEFFYSFCRDGWRPKAFTWHCRECGKCRKRGEWHCGECKKCRRADETVCHRCGGVSKSNSKNDSGDEGNDNDEVDNDEGDDDEMDDSETADGEMG